MKRLVDQELRKWTPPHRKSLLLRGARQAGKTFAARKLGETYSDFWEINLEKRKDLHSIFQHNLDPTRILRDLSIDRGNPILPGKTLLFIDEIQSCPEAIVSFRYFYEELHDLHIIGAGSLLEFALEQIGIPVGRVQTLTVFPMSFAEFLVAKGKSLLLEAICEKAALPDAILENTIRLLSEYFAVGGLPEIVGSWVKNEEIFDLRENFDTLIVGYRQDFEKYAKKNQLK